MVRMRDWYCLVRGKVRCYRRVLSGEIDMTGQRGGSGGNFSIIVRVKGAGIVRIN